MTTTSEAFAARDAFTKKFGISSVGLGKRGEQTTIIVLFSTDEDLADSRREEMKRTYGSTFAHNGTSYSVELEFSKMPIG